MTDDDFVEKFVERLRRTTKTKSLNYIELSAAIRRFRRLNPDADPAVIDWVGVWDPALTFRENIENLQRNYPMFRWREDKTLELDEEAIAWLGRAMASEEVEKEKVEEAAETVEEPQITLALLARYPFLPEARDLASAFQVEELLQNERLLRSAEARVIEAIRRGDRGTLPRDDPLEDLLTYGLGSFLVAVVGDPWLRRRWALAEAMRVKRFLLQDPDHVVRYVAGVLGIPATAKLTKEGVAILAASEVEVRILRRLEEVKIPRGVERIERVREVVERIRGMLATRYARTDWTSRRSAK